MHPIPTYVTYETGAFAVMVCKTFVVGGVLGGILATVLTWRIMGGGRNL